MTRGRLVSNFFLSEMSLFDEEEFDSDTTDDDYIPSGGEGVSEDSGSGEEEVADDLSDPSAPDSKKKKSGKSKKKKAKTATVSRKRTGGIKLEGEDREGENTTEKDAESESYNKILGEQIEKEKECRKQEDEKQKSNALWADFMKDVGGPKPKPKPKTSLSTLSTGIKSPSVSKEGASSIGTPGKKVTITKEFDFAGETVKITKEVSSDSREARSTKVEEEKPEISATASASLPGLKRPGGGLGGILQKIGKKPKISTLDKSKLDWSSFKKDEGIEEELSLHNRSNKSYLERKAFLERADFRQFEQERDIRLKQMDNKR